MFTLVNKLGLAWIKATNHRLEDVIKKKQKREKIVEKRKAKVMAAKRYKAREEISSSNVEEENYKRNTKDDIGPDKANDKYLLQIWKAIGETSYGRLKWVIYLLIRWNVK